MPKKLRRVSKKAAKRTSKSKRRHRRSNKKINRRFGSEMSLAQSVIGMSPSQFNNHLQNIPMSLRSNFYMDI